jgi:hypothetical protein
LSCLRGWMLVGLVAILSACSPEIGDDCATALDCSASGTRLCDMTQSHGYCTLEGCEANTCPSEAICVEFGRRLEGESVERLARTFCMLKCDGDGDCRESDGYYCAHYNHFGDNHEAQILGSNRNQGFCSERPSTFVTPDAGMSEEEPSRDAGMSTPKDAATSSEDAAMSLPDDDAGSAGN